MPARTIAEARAEIDTAERAIHAALTALAMATGLRITAVEVDLDNTWSFGGPNQTWINAVHIRAELGLS